MMKPPAIARVTTTSGEATVVSRLGRLLAAGTLAVLAAMGVASAQTVHVNDNNVTSSSQVGFSVLALGTAGSAGFVSSSTLTNQAGGGLPTPSGTEITNIAFAGASNYKSGVYAGSTLNVATSPFGGTSLLKYLVAQGTTGSVGTVTITYSVPQDALQILWGTIGVGDTLKICNGTNCSATALAQFTGQTIINDGGVANQNASIRITGLPLFTTIQVSDNNANPAFEFLVGQPAPEPASIGLFSLSVAGIGFLRWRRKGAA